MTDREFCTVYLPNPDAPRPKPTDVRACMPSGEKIPNVTALDIHYRPDSFVEVTVKMLARVEQAEG